MNIFSKVVLPIFVVGLLAMAPDVADAQSCRAEPNQDKCSNDGGDGGTKGKPDKGGDDPVTLIPTYYTWMDPDVASAFDTADTSLGGGSVTGVGTHLIILDNFSGDSITGNLDDTTRTQTHGEWTSLQTRLVAPGATFTNIDQPSGRGRDTSGVISDRFSGSGLQVVNLSFALVDPAGTELYGNYSLGNTLWDSLVAEADKGTAVFVKAAGNDGGATVTSDFVIPTLFGTATYQPSLARLLLGSENVLFVGALEENGTVASKATLAAYSTQAGTDAAGQYLVVGVEAGDYQKYVGGGGCDTSLGTCLFGTSFAAPIVSGYAALIGDKFNTAAPADVVDQLLKTARTDTIADYSENVHGQGEACLFCALSPNSIPIP